MFGLPACACAGDILEHAEDFVVVFMLPGYYTGYCDLQVKALRIEGIRGSNSTFIDCRSQGITPPRPCAHAPVSFLGWRRGGAALMSVELHVGAWRCVEVRGCVGGAEASTAVEQ